MMLDLKQGKYDVRQKVEAATDAIDDYRGDPPGSDLVALFGVGQSLKRQSVGGARLSGSTYPNRGSASTFDIRESGKPRNAPKLRPWNMGGWPDWDEAWLDSDDNLSVRR